MAGDEPEDDLETVRSMQDGVRGWVLRAAGGRGLRLRQASPTLLLSLLCASALGPVIAVAGGVTGAVAAGIGVLSSVGGGVLGDLVSDTVNRLRRQGKPPSQDELEVEVAKEIERVLDAGNVNAQALRVEIAAVLRVIDVGGIALRAAVEAGDEQLRSDIVLVMGELGTGFDEMRFLLNGIERAAGEIQERLDSQDMKLQLLVDQNSQQLTQARLTREAIRLISLRSRAGDLNSAIPSDGGPRWPAGSPYRGLLPFDEAHAEVFYGRERLTAELCGKIARRLAAPSIVIVTGASGAGKSSLLRAGLLPALARGLQLPASADWLRLVITPTGQPLTELATHLAALAGADAATLRVRLANDPAETRVAVHQAVVAEAHRQGTGQQVDGLDRRLVLIVDQFEQIFTLCLDEGGEAERRAFIAALYAAATGTTGSAPPALVIIAVRGDFWDRCAAFPEIAEALQDGQFVVGPMTQSDLRLAITGPADAAGLQVDSALTEMIVSDLGSARVQDTTGILPLLSQAMLLTWENREGDRMTVRSYDQTGGISHAVQASADAAYAALPAGQRVLARELLRTMTVTDSNGRSARRPVAIADLYRHSPGADRSGTDAILEAFASRRLIVLSDGTAEIAHDALLEAWPLLRAWLEEDQASWILHSQLIEDAAEWHDNHRDNSFLYRGTKLEAVQRAADGWTSNLARYPALTSTQSAFLEAGQHAETVRGRRLTIFASALVFLLLASLVGGGLAVAADKTANQQRTLAVFRQLLAQSESLDSTDPVTASLLAAAAWHIDPDAQARVALLDALAQPERAVLTTSPAGLDVAFSPDGSILATASTYGGAQLWDTSTHREIGAPLARQSRVTAVAFSPNAKILATDDTTGTVQLWEVSTRRPIGSPITVPISRRLFSPWPSARAAPYWPQRTGTAPYGSGM